ncbi:PrpR N-terminal domain-containing protein [Ornithinibacillus sp. 179-J 7C1 HS]|uniref:sigma-54-dependent Fis family transcriptional regulator n=1 Tax=Ornithinibacillus sp. 179-J 7C1 HS TaxID=3142384 RepID=UPI0039A3006A
MKKIKILAIAPYYGLKELIDKVADEIEEIEVHTYVGDMLNGVKLVQSKSNLGYDFILSRAGTAEQIQKITDLPVIDMKLSIIDMMRAIKLAQNYSGRFGIVGFKSITETAEIIGQLNNIDLEIQTLHFIADIENAINHLKSNGVSLIVGDVITVSHAKKLGLHSILVTSGRETVLNAFSDIISINNHLSKLKEKTLLTEGIIQQSNESVLAFNKERQVIYSSIKENDEVTPLLVKECTSACDKITEDELVIVKTIQHDSYHITGKNVLIEGKNSPTFYIKRHKSPFKPMDKSIIYKNSTDSPQVDLDTFTSSNIVFTNVIHNAKSLAITDTPILLYGEKGTGKDTLAHAIYQRSNYHNKPMVIIDVMYMNNKKWELLFESDNSPFLQDDLTIYIRNLHLLNEEYQILLESYFCNSYVHKRNRLIFSFDSTYSKTIEQGPFVLYLRNDLGAFPLSLPSLNERTEDIPSIVSLFLSEMAPKYGNQILGLKPEALNQLQKFHWTFNLDQLKRVVEELFILTNDFYVDESTVNIVLNNKNITSTESPNSLIQPNKTLEQINKEIIEQVLLEENYNQTKAANRLGISRSTLWRKIN